jgi:MFS family permease
MNAVFPFIKAEWSLSDTQLGALVSVVALTVGVFSFPISVLADRFGRVRCVTIMAVVWGSRPCCAGSRAASRRWRKSPEPYRSPRRCPRHGRS